MSEAPPMQEPTFAPGHDPNQPDTSEGQQSDYFGFDKKERFYFPDKVTWIEFQCMNEGQKKDFQDSTSTDMVVERKSGDARMTLKQGTQRHELIKKACTDWNLKRGGVPVPFGKVQLGDFLTLGDPKIVEALEKAIRKANPWLMADMTSQDIKDEIQNLEEMLKEKEKEEAGEAS